MAQRDEAILCFEFGVSVRGSGIRCRLFGDRRPVGFLAHGFDRTQEDDFLNGCPGKPFRERFGHQYVVPVILVVRFRSLPDMVSAADEMNDTVHVFENAGPCFW